MGCHWINSNANLALGQGRVDNTDACLTICIANYEYPYSNGQLFAVLGNYNPNDGTGECGCGRNPNPSLSPPYTTPYTATASTTDVNGVVAPASTYTGTTTVNPLANDGGFENIDPIDDLNGACDGACSGGPGVCGSKSYLGSVPGYWLVWERQ